MTAIVCMVISCRGPSVQIVDVDDLILLEIAAAALAWQDDPLELLNHLALVAALAKVRP